jgi:hypothetical protein
MQPSVMNKPLTGNIEVSVPQASKGEHAVSWVKIAAASYFKSG